MCYIIGRNNFHYPGGDGEEDACLWLNRGSTYEGDVAPRKDVAVVKLGLSIPMGAASFEDFSQTMDDREGAFRQTLSDVMKGYRSEKEVVG